MRRTVSKVFGAQRLFVDHIKVSGHTDERVFAGDEDDLLVVGRPCGGLDTAVYAADDLDLCPVGG